MTSYSIKFGKFEFKANEGDLLLFSLMKEGIYTQGINQKRKRGGFCGMGVCQECLVELSNGKDTLACQTIIQGDMEIIDYE